MRVGVKCIKIGTSWSSLSTSYFCAKMRNTCALMKSRIIITSRLKQQPFLFSHAFDTTWLRQLLRGSNLREFLPLVALMSSCQAVEMNRVSSVLALTLDASDCGGRFLELVISKPKTQTNTDTHLFKTEARRLPRPVPWTLVSKRVFSETTDNVADWWDDSVKCPARELQCSLMAFAYFSGYELQNRWWVGV